VKQISCLRIATGITVVVIVLFEVIPMSTIATASIIIRTQQDEHIIYQPATSTTTITTTTTTTTTTRPEEEHVIAIPSQGLFLALESRESIKLKNTQNDGNIPSLNNKTLNKNNKNNNRILIVDDEPDVAFTFKMVLENNGFRERIDVYNDPSLVLNNFRAGSYGLVLLDVAMPRIDGFTLYEKIRRIDDEIKVFFITGFGINYEVLSGLYSTKDYEDIIATILENSGGRFIRKPVDVDDLVKRVKAEM
jgi:CheY-like chemotaxis protein